MFRWLKNTAPSLGQRRGTRFRPALETLEARDCPSTTVGLTGNTLNITGDDNANNVTVVFRDGVNDLQVRADGVNYHFSSIQVQNLNVDLKGGNDNLTMQLGYLGDSSAYLFDPKNITVHLGGGTNLAQFWFGGLDFPNRVLSTNLNLNVFTGDGSDEVDANFGEVQYGTVNYNLVLGNGPDTAFVGVWGNIDTGATLSINRQGGNGGDKFYTFATYNGGYDNVNIAPGGLLAINVTGGTGNDLINLDYGGRVLGKLQIHEDGGAGSDTLNGTLYLEPGSTGAVDAVLMGGGGGRDNLTLDVYGSANTMRALIDGGSFWARASGTPNVTIIDANGFIVPIVPINKVYA